MPGLDGAALLSLADRAPRRPVERGLAVLAVAGADGTPDWRDRPLGHVAGALLRLRAATLGAELEGVVACAGCGESLEVRLPVDELVTGRERTVVDVDAEGFAVRARPLTAADLDAAASTGDLERARRALLAASVIHAQRDGRAVATDELPPSVVTAVAAALEGADPLADPVIEATCPNCDEATDIPLDVATFVWTELASRGRHLLVEVDALARRYGWSEAEILALPDARRRRYLELGG